MKLLVKLALVGWQFLCFNFYNEGTWTSVKGYQMSDNFVSFNSTQPTRASKTGFWEDSDQNVFTVGAMMQNTAKATEFLSGIIHELSLY